MLIGTAVAVAAGGVAVAVHNSAVGADSIVTTAGQTPEATAAAMRQAATPKQDNWIDITGENADVPFGVAAPGAVISGTKTNGKLADCTITAALEGNAVATAGHCGAAGSPRQLSDGPNGTLSGTVGSITQSVDEVPSTGPVTDAAIVQLSAPISPAAVRVAGRPVAGVMTMDAVRDLPNGTTVCFDGAKSGVRCGGLISASDEAVKVAVDTSSGDSGAPVFLVDGRTNAVTLIGIHSGDQRGSMYATYLDPALDRFDADLLVDPSAAAAVAGDPRYSTRVTPLS